MDLKIVLDPKLGSRIRWFVVALTSAATLASQFVSQLEAARWSVSAPLIIGFIANHTKIGNRG